MSALRGPQPQCGLDPARERGRRPFPQDSWSRCTKKPETSAPRAGRQIPEQPRALGPRRRRGAARREGGSFKAERWQLVAGATARWSCTARWRWSVGTCRPWDWGTGARASARCWASVSRRPGLSRGPERGASGAAGTTPACSFPLWRTSSGPAMRCVKQAGQGWQPGALALSARLFPRLDSVLGVPERPAPNPMTTRTPASPYGPRGGTILRVHVLFFLPISATLYWQPCCLVADSSPAPLKPWKFRPAGLNYKRSISPVWGNCKMTTLWFSRFCFSTGFLLVLSVCWFVLFVLRLCRVFLRSLGQISTVVKQ